MPGCACRNCAVFCCVLQRLQCGHQRSQRPGLPQRRCMCRPRAFRRRVCVPLPCALLRQQLPNQFVLLVVISISHARLRRRCVQQPEQGPQWQAVRQLWHVRRCRAGDRRVLLQLQPDRLHRTQLRATCAHTLPHRAPSLCRPVLWVPPLPAPVLLHAATASLTFAVPPLSPLAAPAMPISVLAQVVSCWRRIAADAHAARRRHAGRR